ncbi:hypothetical protein FT643_21190 [Ketobacter sp. MCCC 1A13808]|uniref:hypothetical protein n=1 Tax=Ketobacter sp. MCCC 1A13808 TaxID=2602738 RepID=UPI000F1A295B|nr:hypothetical protein [Ketobacter sp. MCCC 1A13808]MVF14657.1 hypothetical protein [Ketobacter sp. MCCC 1A13808]RLP53972.1 MAG: hypothetical protein D6160_12960 [Ketobacter sp.]
MLIKAVKNPETFALILVLAWLPQAVIGAGATPDPIKESPVVANQLPASGEVARQEMQNLMDHGVQLLVPELVNSGTFYPFAVMLGHDGNIRVVGTEAGERTNQPQVMVAALVKKSQQLAIEKRIRAVAFFMDYVASRRDTGFSQAGIRVELDHLHPDALSVFVPYSITSDKKLRLMTPQYNKGKNVVF